MACQTPAYSFDPTAFVAMFPAFATTPNTTVLGMLWDQAGQYIDNAKRNCGPGLACTTPLALNLMTAHLAQLFNQAAAGIDSGILTSATIDKITTTIMPPPVANQWQYWLASTPYGAQLLALLQVKSVGGFYVPGGPGRAGFRN